MAEFTLQWRGDEVEKLSDDRSLMVYVGQYGTDDGKEDNRPVKAEPYPEDRQDYQG